MSDFERVVSLESECDSLRNQLSGIKARIAKERQSLMWVEASDPSGTCGHCLTSILDRIEGI